MFLPAFLSDQYLHLTIRLVLILRSTLSLLYPLTKNDFTVDNFYEFVDKITNFPNTVINSWPHTTLIIRLQMYLSMKPSTFFLGSCPHM